MSRSKFWMVLGNGVPTVRHCDKKTAEREAERLARVNPGQPFTVLESLATAIRSDIAWETHEDQPPF